MSTQLPSFDNGNQAVPQSWQQPEVKPTKPWYKKWWAWLIGIIVILALAGSCGGGESSENAMETDPVTSTTTQTASETEASSEAEEAATSSAPVKETTQNQDTEADVPKEYKNALRSAKMYSDMMHMSKQGIYDQLTSEYADQFSPEAAQYAVDNLKADYNKNALESARTYEDTMAMSPDAIYDQLISEYGDKFTAEEAQYAVDNL
ncbi:Ltp family lipoprotein [Corynebacterium pyruviciproducens]|uniref:Ltp family lipoprotein n=1 Tax=Corynebacterium pyruviciproducens TaxID=598660 RepID=A0AAF0YXL8_9CORY|nr:Ltp family lipoprotein [Corynebacterium pyruviciproducens]MDK6564966.1 Ltp family lipoprotein [Corynebacterium pyruviciproducens]WOT02385.1 Ltp family lipoprotein [Corynebacterium pyruviciproducens]